ncbi:MAG: hypothetical protein ISQ28_01240 [Alphaproteobacteria bacterium]|nr:hypothetical protein [Alphaproteobacteria bacterium]
MLFGLKSLYAFLTDLFSGADDPVRAATEAASTPDADFVTSLDPPAAVESATADERQSVDSDEDEDDADDEEDEEDEHETAETAEAAVQLALTDTALADLGLLAPSSAPALATDGSATDDSASDGLASGLLTESDDGLLL